MMIFQELQDIKAANLQVFKNINVSEKDLFLWKGLIVPVSTHLIKPLKLYFVT